MQENKRNQVPDTVNQQYYFSQDKHLKMIKCYGTRQVNQ